MIVVRTNTGRSTWYATKNCRNYKMGSLRAWCKKQGLGFRVITEREIYNKPQQRKR